MKLKPLSLTVGLLNCVTFLSVLQANEISSWKGVEHEWGEHVAISSFKQHAQGMPTFKRLLAERNVTAFLEMSAQRESLPVQMVGFFGLAELVPQTALEVGFKMALSPDAAAHAMPLYAALKDISMDKGFDQALTLAFRTAPVDVGLATVLVHGLPQERLRTWFQADDRGWALPTYEAIVLDRLFSDLARDKMTPTKRMQDTLSKFGGVPGMPRVVYLTWAEESESNYKQAMTLALEDESLPFPSLHGLLRTKAAYISQNMNLGELKVSDERRKKLATALAAFNERNPKVDKSGKP